MWVSSRKIYRESFGLVSFRIAIGATCGAIKPTKPKLALDILRDDHHIWCLIPPAHMEVSMS
jgi:hypothetical protein